MKKAFIAAAAVSIAALAAPAIAPASGGGAVTATGKCSAASTSKLKLKQRDGDVWKVKIKDNGDVAFKGTAKTKGPSGSFSIEKNIADLPGGDTIKGVARNTDTGERCVAVNEGAA